jgi:hypothetical protein
LDAIFSPIPGKSSFSVQRSELDSIVDLLGWVSNEI